MGMREGVGMREGMGMREGHKMNRAVGHITIAHKRQWNVLQRGTAFQMSCH